MRDPVRLLSAERTKRTEMNTECSDRGQPWDTTWRVMVACIAVLLLAKESSGWKGSKWNPMSVRKQEGGVKMVNKRAGPATHRAQVWEHRELGHGGACQEGHWEKHAAVAQCCMNDKLSHTGNLSLKNFVLNLTRVS